MHLLGRKIKYPNLRFAMRPVPHSDDLPVPTPPVNKDLLSSSDKEMPSREDSAESISLEDIESTSYLPNPSARAGYDTRSIF